MAPVYEKKREIDTSFLFTSLFQLQLIVWHPILVFPLITSFDNMHSPHWSRPFIRSIFVTVSQFFPSLSQGVYFCIIFGGANLDPMTVWGSWMWCWMWCGEQIEQIRIFVSKIPQLHGTHTTQSHITFNASNWWNWLICRFLLNIFWQNVNVSRRLTLAFEYWFLNITELWCEKRLTIWIVFIYPLLIKVWLTLQCYKKSS